MIRWSYVGHGLLIFLLVFLLVLAVFTITEIVVWLLIACCVAMTVIGVVA